MDPLAAMATFVRVVDAGSLSAAARSLPSSLTSVSRQISALEEHFGTSLLLRTTRHLALTADGRILYERAKSILGELREVETTLSRGRHAPSGRIRISAPTLIGRLLIAPSIWSRKTSTSRFASDICRIRNWSRASLPTCG